MAEDASGMRVIEKAESMTPRERLAEGVYSELNNWVRGEFRQEFKDLLRKKGKRRDIRLVEHTRDLARALYIIGSDEEAAVEWHDRVVGTLFGDTQDSVVNVLGREQRSNVEHQLIGPISTLTFLDLVHRADPGISESMVPSRVLASGEVDVKNKVDIELRFGDRNEEGKEIVRLVQLKTSGEDQMYMDRVNPVNIQSYFNSVSEKDVIEIVAKKGVMEREEDIEVIPFVVIVPAVDAPVVSNVYGKIREQTTEGSAIVNDFRSEGQKLGLLPRKESA